MRLPLVTLLMFVLAAAAPARADQDEIAYAIEQLAGNGPASFAKILFPKSPEAARRLTTELDNARARAGLLLDHEIISRVRLTSRLTRLVIVLHYEQQPVFVRIDRYTGGSVPLFLNPKVSRDIEDVVPDEDLRLLELER